ncbi:DUF4214 domain-containing protein [Methylobacterium nigriterrae]|uniref:DUF4214 domain-containing protein n=1 Tax=Methylobacterium nigriterrae TaxID=3127512 RepID=UPI003013EBF0
MTPLDSLVLRVAADSYNGDPNFTVKINGIQVGGTFTTGASFSDDAFQDIGLTGDFSWAKQISVTFLNDAFVDSSQDRNLYVDSLTFNGLAYDGADAAITLGGPNGTAAGLYGTGSTATFNVNGYSDAATLDASLFGALTFDVNSPGGQVYALYEGLLARDPDPLSEGWVTLLEKGASLHDVTQAILGSPEGQPHFNASDNAGYVEQLYQAVLGRSGDAAGAQYWTAALNGGASRADVADSFVFSAEHVAQLQPAFTTGVFVSDPEAANVARLYYALLDRAPDAGGLQTWDAAAEGGTPLASIAQSFLSSPEYASLHPTPLTDTQYVEALYQGALGRTADAAGELYWVGALTANALTRAQVAVGIGESVEAFQHLTPSIESGWHLS